MANEDRLCRENKFDFGFIFPNSKNINGKLYVEEKDLCKLIDIYTELKCDYEKLKGQHEKLLKMWGKSAEECKEVDNRIAELEARHQSDCITINQLNTALDVMTEKYQRLRNIHGL